MKGISGIEYRCQGNGTMAICPKAIVMNANSNRINILRDLSTATLNFKIVATIPSMVVPRMIPPVTGSRPS